VIGSVALMPNSRALNARDIASAPATPIAMPTAARRVPSLMISARISAGLAPSAMRTPISCVRSLTE